MPFTDTQLSKLGQNRKLNPPSFYNSATGEQQGVQGETEAALILIGASVKQKAAQYLDLLLDANPSQSDYDTITVRSATKQLSNLTTALAELEPVISSFAGFRRDLLGSGSTERLFAEGMQPLLLSLLRGIGRMRNRIDTMKFAKKINLNAENKHASGLSDGQRKEWRSWKRVLLAYP
ncbi:hypothetical protein LCGC14_0607900 [marine sediment metagenome]|uniref:Uncharacterized protein n=1 Tax=marine sediment metagenome TaxID=412755 RepID=A0A0F9RDD1_9ZZZZ